jgi:hypothetical protein
VPGWQVREPTPGTHRVCTEIGGALAGRGSVKITGFTNEENARLSLVQEFRRETALPTGKVYRYAFAYRTGPGLTGRPMMILDAYTREGEKGSKQLALRRLEPSTEWKRVEGEVRVDEGIVRTRFLLYLYGVGTVWYDDAFFGEAEPGAANRLKNGGFEPPFSSVYDLAPERRGGPVRLVAGFDNAALGKVKQIGPDEFYVYAVPEEGPRSPYLWFHFRVEGCAGREITFHVNPAPFSRESTSGNGTRIPVVSEDGENWTGVAEKSWSEDGSCLTFKHRFTRSPAWICSFFPFTGERVTRFIARNAASPYFTAGVLGKTREGRDLRYYTITDPAVPEAEKRVLFFTTLQHDLETTGALALEGLCRYLLSDDPGAARLRRSCVTYVVPMMDPDGIAGGNLYCPVGNMNRQWGLGTTPEVGHVEHFAKQLAERGRPIDLFMDFHGWCTPERSTSFSTFGRELADEATEADALRLVDCIKKRLQGKAYPVLWRKMESFVTSGVIDLRRMAPGWMRFEASARLAYSIEIFGEGECTQQGYFDWGRAFAEGIDEFYAR